MHKNILIILALCCIFSLYAEEKKENASYFFHNLTINDGLSHADANTVVQDSKGYIWIGTYSGLDRYDGYRLKSFYNELSYINKSYLNRISDISIDKTGKLWLATFSGIQLFNPYLESYIPIKIINETPKDSEHEIKKILYVDNSHLFIIDNRQKIALYKILNENTLSREPFSLDANCYSLFKDTQQNTWISTDKGIWRLNSQNQLMHIFLPQLNNRIDYTFIDHHNNLLAGGNSGLFYFTCNTDTINHSDNYELKNGTNIPLNSSFATITHITESTHGDYWVSTLKGLFHILRKKNEFHTETIYAGDYPNSLNSDYINGLLIDKSNNLFIASYGAGISILDLNKKPFHIIQRIPFTPNTLSEKIVRAVVEDKNDLWIGTNSMGLNRYNLLTDQFTIYQPNPGNGLRSGSIRALAIDKDDYLWVGHTKGIDMLPLNNKNSVSFLNGQIVTSFPETEVSSIAVDCFNQIWVGTWFNGLCRIYKDSKGKYQTEILRQSKPDYPAFTPERILTVYADSIRPEILFSSGKKLTRIFLNEDGTVNKTLIYQANNNKQHSLSSNFICSIEREDDSTLWIGCIGGGLNKVTLLNDGNYEAQSFFDKEGLKLKDVECLQKDGQGNIWLAGNGIVRYHPETNTFKPYTIDNTYTNSYKVGASYKGKSGNIYFGGINGLIYFNSKEIAENPFLPQPEISAISINNQLAEVQKENRLLPQSITYLEQIKLHYNQNNFTLFFTPLHYANPGNCKFRYRLLGYDKEWNVIEGNNPYASYANLPYGDYIFELQAANNDGLWNNEIRTLKILITPPWWLSLPSKIIYGILILACLIIIYYYLLRWVGLKKQLEFKNMEEKKNEEMHQLQLQFFTNISHEFRTPLTLILGTVEQMSLNKAERGRKEYINILSKNAQRLMRLVNELMDFRKAETGSFHLIVQEKYINDYLEMITNEFHSLAQTNEIHFEIYMDKQYEKVWFDPQLIEKIFLNLLNNAFKYTKKGGCIEVKVLSEIKRYKSAFANSYTIDSGFNGNKYFYICIKDDGIGISKDSIDKVFNRYYQIEDSEHDPHLGSGVGLALVKSLILLHKGRLTVYSERDKGSEFIVAIPCEYNDYLEEERTLISQTPAILTQHFSGADTYTETESKLSLVNKANLHILLVEDNDDVRHFLSQSLSEAYNIREAINGVDALAKIEEDKPDLIISDLMMPQMDGNKLCSRLKENSITSTIPFIMLTAKDTLDARIEGLNSGADAYLSKPVSIQLLLSTIQNLLTQQKRIKEHLSSNYLSTAIDDTMQMKDKDFYDQLILVIESNIANIDLDVDFISKELSLSRTKLYQRVKDLTGKPIMELVRSIRLRKATQIMVEEDISIQEIITKIGIQSQSYFTSSFKKEFGKTPTQFLKELKGNPADTNS